MYRIRLIELRIDNSQDQSTKISYVKLRTPFKSCFWEFLHEIDVRQLYHHHYNRHH